MSPNTDRPILTAVCFVAVVFVLAGAIASVVPTDRVMAIMQTASASEAALDPASIGYGPDAMGTRVAQVDQRR